MAESDRQASDSLAAEMVLRPYEFNFFLAVRRLESEYLAKPRVGSSIRLAAQVISYWVLRGVLPTLSPGSMSMGTCRTKPCVATR